MSLGLAVLGSSALGAGASLFGASQSAKAAREAARAQEAMFAQQRADLAPWREAGAATLPRLSAAVNTDFTTSPGYEWRRGEGMRAIQDGAAARGRLNSGATLQALQRYGQDYASNEYDNWLQRLFALSGIGSAATNATGQFGAQAAGNIGNANMAAGNAYGSGAINAANAINAGVGNLAQLYAMQNNPIAARMSGQPAPGWGGIF